MTPLLTDCIITPAERTLWDDFVARSAQGHPLQAYGWGELKAAFGWPAVRLLLYAGDQPVAGAQLLFRRLLPGLSLAYVPRGPVVTDEAARPALIQALIRLCQARRAILLKVEPEQEATPEADAGWRQLGFLPSPDHIQPLNTIHLDLTADLETIRAGMKPKTRYNIGLAGRKGVTVRVGGIADLPAFYRLLQETGQRDRFWIHSFDYYRTCLEALGPACQLFLAEFAGQIIAGIIVLAFGQSAIYLYGASSNTERNRMPNHLLQWQAISWAKAQGCRVYDLWGIPDEVSSFQFPVSSSRFQIPASAAEGEKRETGNVERDTDLWGVYRFKAGFGGRVVHYLGAYDYVLQPAIYRLWRWAWPRYRAWRSRRAEKKVEIGD